MKVSIRNGKGSIRHNARDEELMQQEKNNDKHTLGYSHIKEELSANNRQLVRGSVEDRISAIVSNLKASFTEWNSHQKNKDRHKPTDEKTLEQYVKDNMRETIFQIGNEEEHPDANVLVQAFVNYYREFIKNNPNITIIGAYLHLDEATPHIHFDWVPIAFDFKLRENQKYSMPYDIVGSKAFEQMGYVVAKEDKSRTMNPLSLFTKASQEAWDRAVEGLGLRIDKSSRGTVQEHKDKAQYIKEKIDGAIYDKQTELYLLQDELYYIVKMARDIVENRSSSMLAEEYVNQLFDTQWDELSSRVDKLEKEVQELDDFGLF